jgi:hypothetical protein
MLNPSVADDSIDDPTIRRCIGFAKSWGYSVLSVRNLFPYRATNPKELLVPGRDIIGGERGDTEISAAKTADLVVIAWGAKVPFDRDKEAKKLLAGKELWCLGKTKSGQPRHPLYCPASVNLERFYYS